MLLDMSREFDSNGAEVGVVAGGDKDVTEVCLLLLSPLLDGY